MAPGSGSGGEGSGRVNWLMPEARHFAGDRAERNTANVAAGNTVRALSLEDAAATLARGLELHPLAARVLAARGFQEPAAAAAFLSTRLTDLPDPFRMKGMPAAVGRILRAVRAREKITLWGDYDVD